MSLLVWLPMTKDLSDQGLGGCTITNDGATLDNNGKLGKCYNFNGTTNRIYVGGFGSPKDISIAFWMKRNANTGTRQFLFTAWNGISIELGTTGNIFGKVSISGGEGGSASGGTITTDSGWVHVCYTFEDKVGGKMYINGELKQATASSASINWAATSMNGYIGNYSNINYSGKMNDFRIYDHVLSPKEIEILSRGLVAHYPLNGNGLSPKNYLKNSNFLQGTNGLEGINVTGATCTKQTDCMKVVSNGASSGFYTANFDSITTGDMTTFSAWVKADSNMTIYIGTDGSGNSSCQAYSIGTSWQKISISKAKTTNNANLRIYGQGTFYVKLMKYELGSIATPWMPNPADSAYTAMGYDSTTEYDVSGYGNNMTKTGTITYTSDSARYSVASHFINGSYLMGEKSVTEYLPTDSLTVNLWVKPTTWGTPISCTEGGGWNFESYNNILQFQCYISGVGYKGSASTVAPSAVTDGKWHMLTGVFDRAAQQTRFYIDGELKGSNATGSTNGVGYASNRLIISGEAQSTTPASSAFVGEESDVRIYATALSDTQVAELYQTAASISKNGILFGYELVEG